VNKSVCLPFRSPPAPFHIFSHISITEEREADNQHTRDKHTKHDFEMKLPNPEPNKENTSETSNWQGYWTRERQEKKPKARPLLQHRTQRRMMEGRKKMERRKKGRLLNTGRGKLLIEAKEWRRRVWIVFWGVSLDEPSVEMYVCSAYG
jgi:hypothetical protein